MGRTSQSEQLMELVKTHTDSYLTAYRVGYEAGWQAALTQALKVIEGKQPMKGPTP
jgi:hypothetical protein